MLYIDVYAMHKRAISNFHKMLKPGGVLIIDHRNYDHIIKYGKLPNSSSKLYYQVGNTANCPTHPVNCTIRSRVRFWSSARRLVHQAMIEIGEGDWLDLANCEDSIHHPDGGYDCVICIGNSFAHLPDFVGDQAMHKRAISNFHKMLKPGGVLIIDHRNYDHIIKYGKLPNSSSKLYYQGDRIHKIKTSNEQK
eukprot:sb/3471018/